MLLLNDRSWGQHSHNAICTQIQKCIQTRDLLLSLWLQQTFTVVSVISLVGSPDITENPSMARCGIFSNTSLYCVRNSSCLLFSDKRTLIRNTHLREHNNGHCDVSCQYLTVFNSELDQDATYVYQLILIQYKRAC